MIRRTAIIGTLALGLTAAVVQSTPLVDRFVSSAQSFHQHFHDLQHTRNSLSTIERFVFSLVMTNTRTLHGARTCQVPAPERRT